MLVQGSSEGGLFCETRYGPGAMLFPAQCLSIRMSLSYCQLLVAKGYNDGRRACSGNSVCTQDKSVSVK